MACRRNGTFILATSRLSHPAPIASSMHSWPKRMNLIVACARPPQAVGSPKSDSACTKPAHRDSGPAAERAMITTEVRAIRFADADLAGEKWRPYPLFSGQTRTHDDMACHYSLLSPGHSPHPPHTHVEEEILIVLQGEADILIADGPAAGWCPRGAPAARLVRLLSRLPAPYDPEFPGFTGRLPDVQVADGVQKAPARSWRHLLSF